MSFKIIFAGTPVFALPALQKLLYSDYEVLAVYTQPDRPAGRGLKLVASPVKQYALDHNIPVKQPLSLKDRNVQAEIANFNADIMVDVAYGLFLPKEVLESFACGCINIHPSLLPRWRGASPIQQSIIAGDEITGVTIMQVDEGWDTGPILKQQALAIASDDTAASMHDKLSQLGADLLLDVIAEVKNGVTQAVPQSEKGAIYASKIKKEDANINWQEGAVLIARKVRAFNSWPVAFSKINNQLVRVWKAKVMRGAVSSSPGVIIAQRKDSIDVATGDGILMLLELQLAGGRRMSAAALLNSKSELFKVGSQFYA